MMKRLLYCLSDVKDRRRKIHKTHSWRKIEKIPHFLWRISFYDFFYNIKNYFYLIMSQVNELIKQ